jgi:hypothetical protein
MPVRRETWGRVKASLVLLTALSLFDNSPAFAAKGDWWIGPRFGGSMPIGDWGKAVESGIEGGVSGTFYQSAHAGIGLDAAIHILRGSVPTDDPFVAFLFGSPLQFDLDFIQVTPHVRYVFPLRAVVKPYAQGGAGIYWSKARLHTGLGNFDGSEPHFGYNVGAGVQMHLDPTIAIGLDGAYHLVQVDGPDVEFFTFGASLLFGKGAR